MDDQLNYYSLGGHRGHCDEQRGGGHLAQRRLLLWRDLPAHQRQECVLAKTRRL